MITGIASTVTLPYLRGLASALDGSGRVATLSSGFATLGLATGPAVGGLLLETLGYHLLIQVAVATMAVSAIMTILPARELDHVTAQRHVP